jgi:hypothetical protein
MIADTLLAVVAVAFVREIGPGFSPDIKICHALGL